MFQNTLIEAVENAHTLKSHAGDWNKPESSKAWLMCYNMYGQTQWGATLLNLLGHNLAKTQQPLAILELGSGDHKTFKNLTTGIINHKILYHSVDRKPSSGALIPRSAIDSHDDPDVFQESNVMTPMTKFLVEWNKKLLNKDVRVYERPIEHVHHQHDVFDWTINSELPYNTFDLLIVDIEPHGREIELVDMFEPFMKDEYLIIFKCIGNMDLYGSTMADNVLKHLRETCKLHDMFAVTGCSSFELTRDVFAVCSKVSTDFDGTLYESLLKKGRLEVYIKRNDVIDSVCVTPSKELLRQLTI